MINWFGRVVAKLLLSLRYRIRIEGIEEIASRGKQGILFLPNHPAFIDPVIVYTYLRRTFHPHGFADQEQMKRPVIGWYARRWGVRSIPVANLYGSAARSEIEQVLSESIEGLRHGENLVLWPSGGLYKSRYENLGANSAVETIVKEVPDVRIVLVRTRGLWGSSFGWADGREPKVGKVLTRAIWQLLSSGIFFAPKREVTVKFWEPENFPRDVDRNTMNRFMEEYYNEDAPPNTYVPYTIWEKGRIRTLPEPELKRTEGDSSQVPQGTREIVLNYLKEVAGVSQLKDDDRLAADLGLDSLSRTGITVWLENEFGLPQLDADALETVGDVMLAACGRFVGQTMVQLKPIPPKWFSNQRSDPIVIPEGRTITDVFLKQVAANPNKAAIADQRSGVVSYREMLTACLALRPALQQLEGQYVGIMLPASVGATLYYTALLFAGKTPVMVNWTAGPRNVIASLDNVGVKRVITARPLLERLRGQGIDLVDIQERFVFAEEMRASLSKFAKVKAWLTARFFPRNLQKVPPVHHAAVLFTSGSETLPKAVPLTHENLLTNIRDVLTRLHVFNNDKMIGFLPPFHSFGLTGTILVPLVAGASVVYHPNPMEANVLAKVIEAYRVTILPGTPTFLANIVRIGTPKELTSLRISFTGAEKCPEKVYKQLQQTCSNAVILEGYGVTECSPVITINEQKNPRHQTIGKLLPSLEHVLLDAETDKVLEGPGTGIFCVRGPSVFEGYISFEGQSPFVEINGKQWYNTKDLVELGEDGVFTFKGRLKRFVKLGGEMVSLPAIEAVLDAEYGSDKDEGPVLAVEATPDEQGSELVLFTTLILDREKANQTIRKAGLSGLHSVRRVIRIDEMPMLGTGKTNYRKLKEKLQQKSK